MNVKGLDFRNSCGLNLYLHVMGLDVGGNIVIETVTEKEAKKRSLDENNQIVPMGYEGGPQRLIIEPPGDGLYLNKDQLKRVLNWFHVVEHESLHNEEDGELVQIIRDMMDGEEARDVEGSVQHIQEENNND
jgi:hypothetical protein